GSESQAFGAQRTLPVPSEIDRQESRREGAHGVDANDLLLGWGLIDHDDARADPPDLLRDRQQIRFEVRTGRAFSSWHRVELAKVEFRLLIQDEVCPPPD